MTLILTWLSRKHVVQVSDRRIGSAHNYEDTARKCLMLDIGKVMLAISYTGSPVNFPENGKITMIEDWLFREIMDLPFGMQPGAVIYNLTDKIDKIYSKAANYFNLTPRRRKLSVVMTGFDYEMKKPMMICISNFETLGTALVSNADDENKFEPLVPKNPAQIKVGNFTATITPYSGPIPTIVAHGNISVLDSKTINSLYRRVRDIQLRTLGYKAIREVLVDTIRNAVLRKGDGTISKNCLSASFRQDSFLVETGQHSLNSDEWIMPRSVFPGGGAETWLYSDTLNKRKIEAVKDTDPINADTFRTFIETNEEAKYWIYYEATTEKRVIFWGEVEKVVTFMRSCGLKSIKDLHNLLTNARGWGEKFLAKYYEELKADSLTLDTPVLLIIIATYAQKLSISKLEKDFGLGTNILDIALEVKK